MWSLLLLLMGVCLRMNQRLNLVSPLLSPQFFLKSTTWQVHNLAPFTPKLVPSTPLPGPSGVRRKQNLHVHLQAKPLQTEEICNQVSGSTTKEIIRGLSSQFQYQWEEVRAIQATFASKSIRVCQLCDRLS